MTEWHFDKYQNGWTWRSTTKRGSAESAQCFPDIVDAIADAALHGYVSGTSRIGRMGPLPNRWTGIRSTDKSVKSVGPPQSTLVFRRNLYVRWLWELRASDGHILNRSDSDFSTRADCEADAARNGLTA